MTRGADTNYRFGSKNHWRRTLWNEVLSRTAGRERDECILYLPGKYDLDREVAISKGVPSQNLIAVERDDGNVELLRKKGVPYIQGDILDVLWSWPKHRKIAAVIADYCSGIEWANVGIYDAFERPVLRKAVIAINLQRGRDPWSNATRELLKKAGLFIPLWKPQNSGEMELHLEPVNRAFQFLMFHVLDALNTCNTGGRPTDQVIADCDSREASIKFLLPADEKGLEDLRLMASTFLTNLKPRFLSYRSESLVTMDSAVFVHHTAMIPDWIYAMTATEVRKKEDAWKDGALARRLAAMFAVRTMRGAA